MLQIDRLLKDDATEEKGERARMVRVYVMFLHEKSILPIASKKFHRVHLVNLLK